MSNNTCSFPIMEGMSFNYKSEEELKKIRTAPCGHYRVLQTEYYGDEVQRIEDFRTSEQAASRVAELLTTERCCLIYISDEEGNILYFSE